MCIKTLNIKCAKQQNPTNNNLSANMLLINNLDIGPPKDVIRLPKINDVNGDTGNGKYNGNGARPNVTFLPMPMRKP